jgi:hypothetical protein
MLLTELLKRNWVHWSEWKHNSETGFFHSSPCCQAKVDGRILRNRIEGSCSRCGQLLVQWDPRTDMFRTVEGLPEGLETDDNTPHLNGVTI